MVVKCSNNNDAVLIYCLLNWLIFVKTLVTEMSHFRFANRGMNLKDGLDTKNIFCLDYFFHCVHYICNGTRVFFQMLSFPCHQIRLIIFCCCLHRNKSCDHRHFIFCAGFNATITQLQIYCHTQKNMEYFSAH